MPPADEPATVQALAIAGLTIQRSLHHTQREQAAAQRSWRLCEGAMVMWRRKPPPARRTGTQQRRSGLAAPSYTTGEPSCVIGRA